MRNFEFPNFEFRMNYLMNEFSKHVLVFQKFKHSNFIRNSKLEIQNSVITRSVMRWPLDLHASIHISSVHPELGSNSQIIIQVVNYIMSVRVLTNLFETTLKN